MAPFRKKDGAPDGEKVCQLGTPWMLERLDSKAAGDSPLQRWRERRLQEAAMAVDPDTGRTPTQPDGRPLPLPRYMRELIDNLKSKRTRDQQRLDRMLIDTVRLDVEHLALEDAQKLIGHRLASGRVISEIATEPGVLGKYRQFKAVIKHGEHADVEYIDEPRLRRTIQKETASDLATG